MVKDCPIEITFDPTTWSIAADFFGDQNDTDSESIWRIRAEVGRFVLREYTIFGGFLPIDRGQFTLSNGWTLTLSPQKKTIGIRVLCTPHDKFGWRSVWHRNPPWTIVNGGLPDPVQEYYRKRTWELADRIPTTPLTLEFLQ